MTVTLSETSLALSQGRMTTVAGSGALSEVRRLVARHRDHGTIALLSDGVDHLVHGAGVSARVSEQLAGYDVRHVVAPSGAHGVVLDEATLAAVVAEMAGADLVVSVGSGTVTDLAKAIADRAEIPLVAVQTAASVNGFADPLSVLVVNGAKRTLPTVWPSALVIDHDVLAEAPIALTRSGVGDAAAIWCAPADWYLACALGMDPGPYDPRWIDPVQAAVPALGDPALTAAGRLEALVEALTLGGLVIGGAGTTAPLSGCEHLVSHVLDMAAMAEHRAHDLHGAQVGVASVLSAALWDVALRELRILEQPRALFRAPADARERTLATWAPVDPTGALGQECWAAVERKIARWEAGTASVRAFFDAHAEHARALDGLAADPVLPASALAAWGAATRFSELQPAVDERQARWALEALPFMRDRMTLADLLLFAGFWDRALFDRVFERAAKVGGGL